MILLDFKTKMTFGEVFSFLFFSGIILYFKMLSLDARQGDFGNIMVCPKRRNTDKGDIRNSGRL